MLYKCIRVDNSYNQKRYYCIDQNRNAVVFQKGDFINLIQSNRVTNATIFIRNGMICVRVNGAVKEKAAALAKDETSLIQSKIINKIIERMQVGVVYIVPEVSKFLDQIGLPDFKGINETKSLTVHSLIQKAKHICSNRGKKVYTMGLRAESGAGSEIKLITTSKQRGDSAIQYYVNSSLAKKYANQDIVNGETLNEAMNSTFKRCFIKAE